jgi:hypothetical protein
MAEEMKIKETTTANTKLNTVPLNWKEVYYTNCPLVSASNVDQELGWTKSEFKKIGVNYLFLRARKENDWYPHYIHNLDNLIRFGGLYPPLDGREGSQVKDPASVFDVRGRERARLSYAARD